MKYTYMRKEIFSTRMILRKAVMASVIICSVLGSVQRSYATHAAGADLTYRFISRSGTGDTYEVTGTFYRDCGGVAAPTTLPITISSVNCNYTNSTYSLPKIAGTGQEITFPCSTSQTKCTNAASTTMGFQKYVYRGNVVFPTPHCSDWRISYSVLARNCAITTMQQGSPCGTTTPIYVEATLDNLNFTSNNSPTFSNNPVAFICQFQSFVFNHGVVDVDGDSLYFELIDAMQSHNVSIPYIPPYSGTNPLTSSPAVAIDPVTGDVTMNAQALEIGVIAIRIKEYRNGVMIGSVIRDMQFIVNNCYPNVLPTASGINGTNVYTATVCPGNNLSFFVNSDDTNVANNVTMTWNSGIAGATFTTAGVHHPVGTFSWTPTLANARSQPYSFTVTVRDDNCPANAFQTYSYTIYVPDIQAEVTASTHNGYNISCHGGSDGTITVAPSGGDTPYTYSWAPAGSGSSSSGLAAGTYTIIVTDANGCSKTVTQTLTDPPDIVSSISAQTNVLCNGENTGVATVTASGGVPSYTYSWNTVPVQTGITASNLYAGSYNCVITDLNGCLDTAVATITQATLITPVIDSSTDVTCHGNANGAIYLSVSGGVPGYTYLWNPGNMTTQDVTGLDTGTYVCFITDTNGCTRTVSAHINQPTAVTPLPGLPVSSTDLICNNDSSGTAAVNVVLLGGTPPYSYAWSNGGGGSSVSGLSAGPISVTITDALGCTADTAFTISQPLPLTSNATNPSPYFCGYDVSCNGATNANVDLSVGGGTPPYSYSWNSGAYTSEDLTNVGAGLYNVTITDTNGCVATNSYTVTQPAPLAVNISSPVNAGGYNIACHGESSGRIHTGVTGGCAQYTYDWGSGPVSADSLIGLPADTFYVTVTDQNGCSINDSIILTEPDTIVPLITSVLINGVNITCNGLQNGLIYIDTIVGGSAPYTWSWSGPGAGGSADSLTGVGAGQFQIHVVDVNGCSSDALIDLTQPDPVAANLSTSIYGQFEISCHGATDGWINIDTVFGGVPSYTFQWANPPSTSDSIGGLGVGVYNVVITDTNGCTDTVDIALTEPDAYLLSATISDVNGYSVSCNGSTNGTIDLSLSGGTGTYYYLWSNGETTSNLTSLDSGIYCAHITDDNNCVLDTCFTLTEPPILSATDSLSAYNGGSNISCFSLLDGNATVTPVGGIAGYSIVWSTSPIDTFFTLSPLGVGTYSYTITDLNGCQFTDSVTLTQPLAISVVQDSLSAILCHGDTTGCIFLTVTGGTSPFTYYWQGEDSTQDQCNLGAGTYQVTITDTNGCVSINSYSIGEPTALANSPTLSLYTGTNVQCNGGVNGYILVNESGGTPAYTYTWTGTTATADSAGGLSAGTYSVLITDSNQCHDSASFTLTEPPAFVLNGLSSLPATCGSANGTAWIDISGGIPPYSYSWNTTPVQTTDSATGIASGTTVTVTVTDSAGCTYTDSIQVNNIANLAATSNQPQNANCNGTLDGTASINVTGGTAPFTYSWSPVAGSNDTLTNIGAGTYTCTVTDSSGCTATASVTISQPTPLDVSASSTNVLCNGDSTGTGTAIVSGGGTPPYSYSWDNGDTNQVATNLPIGTYICTISDSHGCDTTVSVSISEPTILVASATHGNADCHGNATGVDSAFVSGGTPSYTYLWSSGGTNAVDTGLVAGVYTVTITDAHGCSIIVSDTITEPVVLDATISVTDIDSVNCNGGGDGSATVTVSGGSNPYTYAWSPTGGNAATASNLQSGSYSVLVTDANGCSSTATATISEPVSLAVNVSGTASVTCNAGSDGTAIAVVTGGTAAFTYSWVPNTFGSGDTISNLPAGTYTVTVTDFHNCTGTGTFTIADPQPLTTTASTTPEICGSSTSLNGVLLNGQSGVWTTTGAGVTFDDSTSANANVSGLQFAITTTFTWSITDNATGCKASDTAQVIADEPVTAQIDSKDQEICLHSPDYHGNFPIDANQPLPGTGTWSVAAGTGTIDNPSALQIKYTTDQPGTSIIVWNVVNGLCAASDSTTLKLMNDGKCLDLDLPTGFTPNTDTYNDDYDIHGIENYPLNTFIVFNRWGNEVYKKENYVNHDWKGENKNGDPLPDGTYYVILVINDGSNLTRNTYVDLRR